MGKRMVCTVLELAEEIVKNLDTEKILTAPFPDCDFGIIDVDGEKDFDEEEMDFLESGVCGWYGIKKVDCGYDSQNLCLVADYYGGACASFCQLYSGISHDDAVTDIAKAIRDALMFVEIVNNDTKLFVCFDQPEATQWQRYLNYLRDWAYGHRSDSYYGMTPACFDEWRTCEDGDQEE